MKNNKNSVKRMTAVGILSATAFILMLMEFPISFLIPPFIKFDLSDLPALVGAFAYGPIAGVLIELIKNLLHSTVSGSFFIGEFTNFVLGSIFVFVAGLFYKKDKTKRGAFMGSFFGGILMGAISIPFNYLIVYPIYYNFMPKETILEAYQKIMPNIDSILDALICFNMPFTFVKGMIDLFVAFLIYKKISPILKKE